MKCQRCNGMMNEDVILHDMFSGVYNIQSSQCIMCGNVVDLIILKNQKLNKNLPPLKHSGKVTHTTVCMINIHPPPGLD